MVMTKSPHWPLRSFCSQDEFLGYSLGGPTAGWSSRRRCSRCSPATLVAHLTYYNRVLRVHNLRISYSSFSFNSLTFSYF